MEVSFAIMHCDWDPLRRAWVDLIRAEVPYAEVVRDERRSCWDTARRAWLATLGIVAVTHCMVLQDDMLPVDGFIDRVWWAMSRAGGSAISFRRPPSPARWGREPGEYPTSRPAGCSPELLEIGPFFWGGSLLLPREYVWPMIEACDADVSHGDADDSRMMAWAARVNLHVLHYAPEALAHVGAGKSLVGNVMQSDDVTDWRAFAEKIGGEQWPGKPNQ